MDAYQKKYLKYKTKYELLKKQIGGNPTKRILLEIAKLNRDPIPGITININEADILNATGTIVGPRGTPYEGHIWRVNITYPENYPNEPPTVRFVDPIFHPNINQETGAVSNRILKNDNKSDSWNPTLNAGLVLQSIQSMLNADSAFNVDAAIILATSKSQFNDAVKAFIQQKNTPIAQ
jgi:ubiquitin-protein ligase